MLDFQFQGRTDPPSGFRQDIDPGDPCSLLDLGRDRLEDVVVYGALQHMAKSAPELIRALAASPIDVGRVATGVIPNVIGNADFGDLAHCFGKIAGDHRKHRQHLSGLIASGKEH